MAIEPDLGLDSTEPKLFSARLKPHRALSHNGFLILIGLVGTASFAAGLAFWLIGAWPVFGFFGLDVLALAFAFKVSFARARASEEISMTCSELRVRRTSARGEVAEWVLNPLWVRLEKIVHHDAGIERLYLVSSGRRLAIANFLGAEEKANFAKALMAALDAARRGPLYPA
ncbi:DUF2244 domain-containing protein [Rhodopseudomonas palustris]|uniref:DUF2244 domain-containing protein n=1 Tax=Rhodopseudomonas palustris (strain ATCC BAA-98 / CGA009) TaxID=258594 RepID=Q6NCX5_RHOPA|nr:DUF2244 domain-containing protein [Rhodopseudomonas palustris]OPF93226.1 hypothetical protein B1S06_12585 [Rhodopseudomonas palustris]PPQ42677.1 DUF2244 domain-containing protein [Rhodopseudomonas palustris]QQM01838.1 hypothetical protein I8G32_00356 [Rhodopseudomonas palustris]RJF64637.1 DUF2244 domain-containing protein [Rhodopseudomonas palustris]WAB78056.1 DUF2244 domain-containing protein [Rhodopseudomonas palustris]